MTTPVSINENTYGGIADSYASKYGIPSNVFRDAIRATSNFDPLFSNGDHKGIAGLGFTLPDSPNPADVGSSMDFAAKYIASEYKTLGDWTKAAQSFTGQSGSGEDVQYDAMGNTTGYATKPIDNSGGAPSSGGYIGQFTTFLKSSAWSIMFVIVGVVLIVGSVMVLVRSSK